MENDQSRYTVENPLPEAVDPQQLLEVIAKKYSVTSNSIESGKSPIVALARSLFMYLLSESGYTVREIAEIAKRTELEVGKTLKAIRGKAPRSQKLQDQLQQIRDLFMAADQEGSTEEPEETRQSDDNEEDERARSKRLRSNPQYLYWYNKATRLSTFAVGRSHRPIVMKPEPLIWCESCGRLAVPRQYEGLSLCHKCQRKSKPRQEPFPPRSAPSVTQDEWVEKLLNDYWTPATLGGQEVMMVMCYDEAMPLDPVTLSQYTQDDRIILLYHHQSRKQKPGRHCLVFETAQDAEHFIMMYDDPQDRI